ncbi:MAG: hypothetical protein ACJ71D_02465 [Nitrososphaera sp.]
MEDRTGRTLERAIGVNMIVIQFLSDGIPMSETRIHWEMPTALDRVSGGRLEGQDELSCEYCSDKKAEIFQVIGNYCLHCWQQETHPDV